MLACHFLSLLAPRLKSLPCLNTLPLPFRPILRRAEWAWTRYKICKRTLKKCLKRVGDFRVHFDFKWKPKAKARYSKPVSPKWISSVAAMFSSSFMSLWCFFQTVWAGEEALGAGLVAFPEAILPSRGSSFRKAKIWTSLMTQWLWGWLFYIFTLIAFSLTPLSIMKHTWTVVPDQLNWVQVMSLDIEGC